MAMKVSEIRRQKAQSAINVCAMRTVLHNKFDKRMFLDMETSPLDPQIIWMFVGPDCEALTSDQHQQLADTIAENWDMFDGVEMINQKGEVLARSKFDEITS